MDLLRNAHEILGIHVMLSITSFLIRISEYVDEELTAGDRFLKEKFNDSLYLKIRQKDGAFQG